MTAYTAGFIAGFRRGFASRGDLLVRTGFFAAILLVLAALWRTAVDARSGHLAGYDFRALFWYLFAAQCAVSGVRVRTTEEVGDEIGTGAVAVALLRPVSVVGMRLAMEWGEAAVRLMVAFVVGGIMCVLIAGPPVSATAFVLTIPALALACAANIAFQHVAGGVAFWLQDAKSAWFLYQKLIFLPGGMLLPLEMFPDTLASVFRTLPFAAMAYIPGRIASGHVDPLLLIQQTGWLVALIGMAFMVFAAGERRLQVLGG